MIKPISIPLDEKFVSDAAYYAFKTVQCSFENGMKSRFGNGGLFKHILGKLGETAFFRFCLENRIAVKHTPFRNDYSQLNGCDDFIINIMGLDFVVEVKTATIKDPLKPDPKFRLFYNKGQYEAKQEYNYIVVFAAVNPTITQIALLGWIHAQDIAKFPVWRKNMQSPAYAIPVEELKGMEKLVEVES